MLKRFFALFMVALVCLSLCVNIAFASDVITNRYSQNILVYFPWFGGVSGSSANRVTNYATVTTSDVIESSDLVLSQLFNLNTTNRYVTWTTDSNGFTSVSGTPNIYSEGGSFSVIPGHKYLLVQSDSPVPFSWYVTRNGSNAGLSTNIIFTALDTDTYIRVRVYNSSNISVTGVYFQGFDLTSTFGAGNEPTSFDSALSLLSSFGISFPKAYGSYYLDPISSFSLVPAPAANGGASEHIEDDYTWYQYEADISLTGVSQVALSDFMVDGAYSAYAICDTNNGSSRLYYCTSDFANLLSTGTYIQKINYTFGTDLNDYGLPVLSPIGGSSRYYYFSDVYLQTNFSGVMGLDSVPTSTGNYYDANITDYLNSYRGSLHTLGGYASYSDFSGALSTNLFDSNLNSTGTFTIDRIFRVYDNSYFLFNNQVNLGTYDFNVNVKFPSLEKFNNFSGYWLASFNTSWGEIPVRTQIQEVSSNSDTLIKIYKLTFDVPFTGQYTKFNIRYVGDSSAFTTIRVDASVIDPNGYVNGAGPTTINGLSFYLTSMFDKLLGKIRSLFFDQDQTMAESVPSEAAQLAEEVSSGAQTIHEFETNNFDSIEQQQEDLDWDIPIDFGQASNPTSALGFIATVFSGVFFALGSKVTPVIVIPLMLGLCLLILGRGSLALGQLASSGHRAAERIRSRRKK